MALVASIVSAKGGVGASTTTLNLGMALQQAGRDVTIVDANIHTPDIGVLLGAPRTPVTLHHVLQGKAHIKDATYQHESGTRIILGSMKSEITNNHLASLSQHLRQLDSNVILLDSHPSTQQEQHHPRHHAHESLVVTTGDLSSVAHTLKTIKTLKKEGKTITGVIVNKYGHHGDMSVENIEQFLEQPVIAVVPEDYNIKKSAHQKESVVHAYPQSAAAQTFTNLSLFLTGQTNVPPRAPIHRLTNDTRPGNIQTEMRSTSRFLNWLFGK